MLVKRFREVKESKKLKFAWVQVSWLELFKNQSESFSAFILVTFWISLLYEFRATLQMCYDYHDYHFLTRITKIHRAQGQALKLETLGWRKIFVCWNRHTHFFSKNYFGCRNPNQTKQKCNILPHIAPKTVGGSRFRSRGIQRLKLFWLHPSSTVESLILCSQLRWCWQFWEHTRIAGTW